jgi:hypothetical protein
VERLRDDYNKILMAQAVETIQEEEISLDLVVKKEDQHTQKYWDAYGITQATRKRFNVYPIKSVWRNSQPKWKWEHSNPIYGYYFPSGHVKIYRPLNPDKTKGKWYGNSSTSDYGGLAQLPKKGVVCFITSSLKEVMVLHENGFPAVCPNGEAALGDGFDNLVQVLKARFRYVFVLMDSDAAGFKAGRRIADKYGLTDLYVPEEKDLSDYRKKFKSRKTWKCLTKLIRSATKKRTHEVLQNLPY